VLDLSLQHHELQGRERILPSNHIPLPVADSSNWRAVSCNANDYSVSVMNHVNIASNCAQCHGAGKSFANMAPPALKLPPSNQSDRHGQLKRACHAASNFTPS